MKQRKIQIAAYEVRDDEKEFFEQQASTLEVQIIYTSETLNQQSIDLCDNCQAVTTLGQSNIDAKILRQLKLKGVQCLATRTIGYNHIDLNSATELGIKVSNTYYDPNGVADYTVMLMLMLQRKYKQALYRINVNDYSLPGLRGREVKDLTIGIIGTGSIGSQVIQNLSGFGCELLASSNSEKASVKAIAEYVPLDELYARADVISLHTPLTDTTRQMINSDSINQMKDGVTLINCSRGELMKIPDIIQSVENQKIGALALDVFEKETGIYHLDRRNDIISNRDMAYLRQFPNVIMTQHIGFYTDAAVNSMVSCAIASIVSLIETGSSKYQIN